jgi:hypothetical protein
MHSANAASNSRKRVVALDRTEVDALRREAIDAPGAHEAPAIVNERRQFDQPGIGIAKTNKLHGSEPHRRISK